MRTRWCISDGKAIKVRRGLARQKNIRHKGTVLTRNEKFIRTACAPFAFPHLLSKVEMMGTALYMELSDHQQQARTEVPPSGRHRQPEILLETSFRRIVPPLVATSMSILGSNKRPSRVLR